MRYKTETGEELGILNIFRVVTSKNATDKYAVRLIVANSIVEAMDTITPYLEDNEVITGVSKAHELNVWVAKDKE